MEISKYFKNNRLTISVKTNAPKNKIIGWSKETNLLKIEIKSLPEKGKANLEIIKFLNKLLKQKVRLVSGLTSKKKVIEII